MIRFHRAVGALAASLLLGAWALPAQATLYQFNLVANQLGYDEAPDHSLDVHYTVTLDSTKITDYTFHALGLTSTWLGGGVTMTVSFADKSFSINDVLDPASYMLHSESVRGSFLSTNETALLQLSLDPGDALVIDKDLPYDPFVFGNLSPYANQKAFQDFWWVWGGDTSVLAAYAVNSVPEPSTWGLVALGLGAAGAAARRKRAAAA